MIPFLQVTKTDLLFFCITETILVACLLVTAWHNHYKYPIRKYNLGELLKKDLDELIKIKDKVTEFSEEQDELIKLALMQKKQELEQEKTSLLINEMLKILQGG